MFDYILSDSICLTSTVNYIAYMHTVGLYVMNCTILCFLYQGLFPDVGGGYFLPRLLGHLGLYLALTGNFSGCLQF